MPPPSLAAVHMLTGLHVRRNPTGPRLGALRAGGTLLASLFTVHPLSFLWTAKRRPGRLHRFSCLPKSCILATRIPICYYPTDSRVKILLFRSRPPFSRHELFCPPMAAKQSEFGELRCSKASPVFPSVGSSFCAGGLHTCEMCLLVIKGPL